MNGLVFFLPSGCGRGQGGAQEMGFLAIGTSGGEVQGWVRKEVGKLGGGGALYTIGCNMSSSYPDPPLQLPGRKSHRMIGHNRTIS